MVTKESKRISEFKKLNQEKIYDFEKIDKDLENL